MPSRVSGSDGWKVTLSEHPVGETLFGLRHRLRDRGAVAITFDDGPDPTYTPRVLDVLAHHGAPATFFCLGQQVRAHPDLVQRMAREGHAVGSHSDTHPATASMSVPDILRDLRAGKRSVEAVVGRRTTLFRPPGGLSGTGIVVAMRAAGLRGYLWSLDPHDWKPTSDAAYIAAKASSVRGGDVMLLHDGMAGASDPDLADRSSTVEALDAILSTVKSRGLKLVALR